MEKPEEEDQEEEEAEDDKENNSVVQIATPSSELRSHCVICYYQSFRRKATKEDYLCKGQTPNATAAPADSYNISTSDFRRLADNRLPPPGALSRNRASAFKLHGACNVRAVHWWAVATQGRALRPANDQRSIIQDLTSSKDSQLSTAH